MHEYWCKVDLSQIPKVIGVKSDRFSFESGAQNKIGVEVFKNGSAKTLTGSIKASIIKPDRTSMKVNGSKSGNTAYVILPDEAFATSGILYVFLKNINGDIVTTLCGIKTFVFKNS